MLLADFYEARDWERFQTLKDLAAGISIEAGELQELFLWHPREHEESILARYRSEVTAELADVLIYAFNFARLAGIDVEVAVETKLRQNEAKYPVDDVRGRIVDPR